MKKFKTILGCVSAILAIYIYVSTLSYDFDIIEISICSFICLFCLYISIK